MRTAIVFAIDDSYCEPFLVAMFSLCRNNSRDVLRDVDVFLLYEELSEQARQRILSCIDLLGVHLEFRQAVLRDLPFNTAFGGSRAHYLRMAILDTFGERERVVYLDSDILVLAHITALLNVNLRGLPIGAVRDSLNPTLATGRALAGWQRLGLEGNQEYFNSGVLVMDLAACRREGLFSRAFEAVADHSDKLRLWDQDALNIAAADNWYRLDRRWNTVPFSALRRTPWVRYQAECIVPAEQLVKGESEAAIMHYVSPSKPWRRLLPSGQANDLYQEYKTGLEKLMPATFPQGGSHG